jgi:hypothetical protein
MQLRGFSKCNDLRCRHLLERIVFDGEIEANLMHQDG